MIHCSSAVYDLSNMVTVESRPQSLCKLHKYYLCISQVIHKLPQMQSFWSCHGRVQTSHSKPAELCQHAFILVSSLSPCDATTIFHTWLTTRS